MPCRPLLRRLVQGRAGEAFVFPGRGGGALTVRAMEKRSCRGLRGSRRRRSGRARPAAHLRDEAGGPLVGHLGGAAAAGAQQSPDDPALRAARGPGVPEGAGGCAQLIGRREPLPIRQDDSRSGAWRFAVVGSVHAVGRTRRTRHQGQCEADLPVPVRCHVFPGIVEANASVKRDGPCIVEVRFRPKRRTAMPTAILNARVDEGSSHSGPLMVRLYRDSFQPPAARIRGIPDQAAVARGII